MTILGPKDTQSHLDQLREVLFPGSHVMHPRFQVTCVEIVPGETVSLPALTVAAIEARHTAETHPLALHVQVGDKTVAYTGDGAFTESLAGFVAGADLLIAESYYFSKTVKWHLNYPDIARLSAKKIVLTHMHSDMLAHVDDVSETCAYDGLAAVVKPPEQQRRCLIRRPAPQVSIAEPANSSQYLMPGRLKLRI